MNEQPTNQPPQQGGPNNQPQPPQPQQQYGPQNNQNQYQSQPQANQPQQPAQPQYSPQPQAQAPQPQQNYQNQYQQPAGRPQGGANPYQNPGQPQPGNNMQNPEGEIAKLPENKRKLVSIVRGIAIALAVLLALSALVAFTMPAEFYEGYAGEPPASADDESFSYVAGSLILLTAAVYLAVFLIVKKTASLSRMNIGCYVMYGAAASALSGGFTIGSLILFLVITTPPSLLQSAIRQVKKQQG